MLYIDLKYIKLLSPKLSKFKQIDTHSFRFRCVFCGDSKKSESKVRGNVYPIGNGLSYKCFNCGIPRSIGSLIEKIDPSLYKEYVLEKYREQNSDKEEPLFKKEVVEILTDSIIDDLININDLPEDHIAIKYISGRMIPKEKWNRIYYTDTFKQWVNSVLSDKLSERVPEHPRIVFPYFNKHGKVFAANSRSFDDGGHKYIIIKFDNNYDTVYGLDTVNWARPVYVVEGQIDSLFLPNCLAVSGSSFDIDTIRKIKSNCTLIIDNEPRNKQISKLLYSYIEKGYTVTIFPETFHFKDINDAIIGGMKVEEIIKIINKHTFSGLTAKVKYIEWRK